MKKLLFICLLLLTTTVLTAQEQFRRVYEYSTINEQEEITSGGTFIFNYGNEFVVKLYLTKTITFIQESDVTAGVTESGYGYTGAVYRNQDDSKRAFIQLFDDSTFGCRIVFGDGSSIRFY